ncbi:MAG TPA: hypothetical protein VN736_01220 [Candidatus Limnocylindrales bacterium]|nr:hypothetical protein [Candidatus Limnocylindrales bacterium]
MELVKSLWQVIGSAAIAVVILLWWVKAYFEPYLKKKAENLATHEDIQRLIEQVRETERVKADILQSMWDTQERWTARKDFYCHLTTDLTKILLQLEVLTRSSGNDLKTIPSLLEAIGSQLDNNTIGLNVARLFASENVLSKYYALTKTIVDMFTARQKDAWASLDSHLLQIRLHLEAFIVAARQDLGN